MSTFCIFLAILLLVTEADCQTNDDKFVPFKDDAYKKVTWPTPDRPTNPPREKGNTEDITSRLSQNEDNFKCTCVLFHLCNQEDVVSDGKGLIRARTSSVPSDCGDFQVCCKNPKTVTEQPTAPEPYIPQCGKRKFNPIKARIAGNGGSTFGEIPWQVALLQRLYDGDEYKHLYACGGSLIDSQHVLTAAHCVQNYKYTDLTVRLGEWNSATTNERIGHEDYDVQEIIAHSSFREANMQNDVAIIRLTAPVTFKENIDTVCLPNVNQRFVEKQCVVSGWGKDSYGGKYSSVMKVETLNVMDNNLCEYNLQQTILGPTFKLYEKFMCAGGEPNVDACTGDGGGPLACNIDGRYVLAGIVSWGIGCGEENVPGVYTDVTRYMRWIAENIYNPSY